MHTLESIGLSDLQLDDHIEATSGIAPYRSTPFRPPQLTEVQAPHPKPNRVKYMVVKKTPSNVLTNGVGAFKKRKFSSPTKKLDQPVNIVDRSLIEPSELGDVFRRKKLKLTHPHGQKCHKENVGVS